MVNKWDLTGKVRILFHLFDYARHAEDYDAPLEVTQPGIAAAASIGVHHVTQYVQSMITEGLVKEETRRVRNRRGLRRHSFVCPSEGTLHLSC